MRLTQHADFALRTLIFLGLKSPEQLSTIQEIAEAYQVSRNHLMKVVSRLVAHNYVVSVRGAGGGIRLAKAPNEILIGDVVQHMEPEDGLVECLRENNKCVITPACLLPGMLMRARDAFTAELNKQTLQDILPFSRRHELSGLLNISQAVKFAT
ncbi:MAG: Rrf2 family transcriptional regulator [Paraperlucidibaca sp.]|nr:Rrf2 family transcriptional regulator [Paraperlucidibaca sp.]